LPSQRQCFNTSANRVGSVMLGGNSARFESDGDAVISFAF
jgi:hypothetical protein